MGSNPLMKSTMTGVVMQALMVLIGKFVPAIGTMPNFYAIAGTVLAAITGALVARGSAAGTPAGTVATNGAIAGGASSVVGGVLAVVSGQWPGFQILQMLPVLLSGGVGGGVGGMLTRMMAGKSTA